MQHTQMIKETDRALLHLDSIVSSTEEPAIGAWPTKSDDDTSEGIITLLDVDSPLGFIVVVIEPPTGLTFSAFADVLPMVSSRATTTVCSPMWRVSGQPYLSSPMLGSLAQRVFALPIDGILRDNTSLALVASQVFF